MLFLPSFKPKVDGVPRDRSDCFREGHERIRLTRRGQYIEGWRRRFEEASSPVNRRKNRRRMAGIIGKNASFFLVRSGIGVVHDNEGELPKWKKKRRSRAEENSNSAFSEAMNERIPIGGFHARMENANSFVSEELRIRCLLLKNERRVGEKNERLPAIRQEFLDTFYIYSCRIGCWRRKEKRA